MTNPIPINPVHSDIALSTTQKAIFRIGDYLMATVLTGTASANRGGNSMIRIGNGTVQVRSAVGLNQGDVLKLQVTQMLPQTLLTIISVNGVKAMNSVDPLMPHLIHLQTRQGSLSEQLAFLNSVLKQAPKLALQTQLNRSIQQLLHNLANWTEIIRPKDLSQAFLNSGLFLESKLISRKEMSTIHRDFKTSLLRLLQQASNSDEHRQPSYTAPSPPHRDAYPMPQPRAQWKKKIDHLLLPSLLRESGEAILARFLLHQIATAENKGNCWLVEIPIRVGEDLDLLHLRIEKDQQTDTGNKEKRWRVNLAIDPPTLGPINIQASIQENCLSCLIWAEQATTADKFSHQLNQLESALQARGLKVQSLHCAHGTPPPPPTHARLSRRALLDTKA